MGVGHIVLIVVLTVLGLGVLRRLFWFSRWRRRGGYWGRGWHGHRHGHHGFGRGGSGGPASWIARSIDATPEQEAKLSEIVARMRGDFDVLRATRSDLIESLVAVLPGEALDEQALDQMASKATMAYEKLRGDVVESLKELHRTLTPAQRKQVTSWLQRRASYRWA
jgi:Spy/CpxP family protein refolding chaperone